MVLRDGSVKVADFGIACLENAAQTLTQEALGSVHYISRNRPGETGSTPAATSILPVSFSMRCLPDGCPLKETAPCPWPSST